jgi:hypothetical protein
MRPASRDRSTRTNERAHPSHRHSRDRSIDRSVDRDDDGRRMMTDRPIHHSIDRDRRRGSHMDHPSTDRARRDARSRDATE